MLLDRIKPWLSLAELDTEREAASRSIVGRFPHGNVLAQDGTMIDETTLDHMSRDADRAMARLNRRTGA